MELHENMCILIFSFFFIVDTASVLKLLFPTIYRFYLDGYVGGCFVVFNYFIYLFI